MKRHFFESTKDAYNETMSSDEITTGDILIIPSEHVIGVAFAWPFAVSEESGNLHTVKDWDSLCKDEPRLLDARKFVEAGGVADIFESLEEGDCDQLVEEAIEARNHEYASEQTAIDAQYGM